MQGFEQVLYLKRVKTRLGGDGDEVSLIGPSISFSGCGYMGGPPPHDNHLNIDFVLNANSQGIECKTGFKWIDGETPHKATATFHIPYGKVFTASKDGISVQSHFENVSAAERARVDGNVVRLDRSYAP